MNPNTAPLINEHRAPKGAGRRECSIHHDARYGQNVCPDCNQRMDLVCDPLGNRDYYVCFPCCDARKEAAALRELAEGLAKHGAMFMRVHLFQAIAMAEYQNDPENQDLAGRISEMSCRLQDAQDAFEQSAARYRAACPGEGQPSNASNSPTASRESQG
jgi:hypothetical protein